MTHCSLHLVNCLPNLYVLLTVTSALKLTIADIQHGLGTKPDFPQLTDRASALGFTGTSSVLESGSGGAWDSARLESDPAKLLPQLLDQLVALGQTAQQLRHALGGNGYQPEKIHELISQLRSVQNE